MKIRKQANIVIMGDFNDYPDDESMRHTLGAQSIIHEKNSRELYNMFLHKANRKDAGSYRYRGRWIYPDQFIVSGNLLDPKRQTSVRQNEAAVYDAGFMLEDDIKYKGKKPFRTYLGFKYLGGYSDHLPIYIDLVIKE